MNGDITREILALSQIYNNGTEITDDTTDRELFRMIALHTSELIKRKSQSLPFSAYYFGDKLQIKATETGQLFYKLIQNILSLSRVTGNRRKLHPVIPLIVSLAEKYHIRYVPMLSEYYPDSEEDIKQLNNAYCEFIQSVDSKEYKTAVSTFKNSARKNYRFCCRYIENLFERHAKLLVVRTDLSYGKRVSHKVTAQDLNRHRIALYKAIQRLPLFKHCIGYILKLEYGREKGFHYPELVDSFRDGVAQLKAIAETPDAVDELYKEEDQLNFLAKFRDVLRLQNTLKTFSEFHEDLQNEVLDIDEQTLLDYQSKYLDKREDLEAAQRERRKKKPDVGTGDEKGSDAPDPEQFNFDFDFEIDLIKRDEVNVTYIIQLIEKLKKGDANQKTYDLTRDMILNVLQTDPELRHKKQLFRDFIDTKLPRLKPKSEDQVEGFVKKQFNLFVAEKRKEAMALVCEELNADLAGFKTLYEEYIYRNRLPDIKELLAVLSVRPKVTARKAVAELVREKMEELAAVYESSEI
ncbi:inovirus-type Gp2 protein [Morganella morganii]|uniref:type I restriction endonuclease subunit R, EcoR124 family n=1 Tax=Morganella morganii TaxID=582 RepID=UPI0028751A56|nr:hypothetical protein [Morganella morganii]